MPTEDTSEDTALPSERAPRPVAVRHVVVPLSASPASEAALAPAGALARRFGARVHLLTVGIEKAEADAIAARVATFASMIPADVETYVDWDVPDGILTVAGELESSLVCMASHARGRLGKAFLGSYTSELLAATTEPVLLVGPAYDAERSIDDGPVVACVDGSSVSERVIPIAAGWAWALGSGLRIVTVVEPTGAPLDDRPVHRLHGPDGDAQAYVDGLAHACRYPGLDVSGVVVYDPIGPADGLATLAKGSPCGMLAVTTHARRGVRGAVFGSQATSILHHSPVPVLVVPPAHP